MVLADGPHPRHCERSEAIHAATKKVWIASSQELLAMTEYCVGRWAPSTSLRANASRERAPDDRLREVIHAAAERKAWIASSQELLAMTRRQRRLPPPPPQPPRSP